MLFARILISIHFNTKCFCEIKIFTWQFQVWIYSLNFIYSIFDLFNLFCTHFAPKQIFWLFLHLEKVFPVFVTQLFLVKSSKLVSLNFQAYNKLNCFNHLIINRIHLESIKLGLSISFERQEMTEMLNSFQHYNYNVSILQFFLLQFSVFNFTTIKF